jgi:hypothetical protein
MKSISDTIKFQITSLLSSGASTRDIAAQTGTSKTTICRLRRECSEEDKLLGVGRPKALTARQERNIAADIQKSLEAWKRVIWSDETKINLFGSDGRQYCWKRSDAALLDHRFQPTVSLVRVK